METVTARCSCGQTFLEIVKIMSNEIETVEGSEVVETGVVEAVATKKKQRAKSLKDHEFFAIHEAAETRADAIKATDMAPASFEQRCSRMRSDSWPLKHFPRNGGTRVKAEDSLELIAKAKGLTVEQVQAEIAKLKAAKAKRDAEKATTEPTA